MSSALAYPVLKTIIGGSFSQKLMTHEPTKIVEVATRGWIGGNDMYDLARVYFPHLVAHNHQRLGTEQAAGIDFVIRGLCRDFVHEWLLMLAERLNRNQRRQGSEVSGAGSALTKCRLDSTLERMGSNAV